MVFENLIEPGRVCYFNYGPLFGKPAIIVQVVDMRKVLVFGRGVDRQIAPIKRLTPTSLKVPGVFKGGKTSEVMKKVKEMNLAEKVAELPFMKAQAKLQKRAKLGDFDRFRAMILKKQLGFKARRSMK